MDTAYLDPATWDFRLTPGGDLAMAGNPYALAQDAASAIRAFAGEVYYDTTQGIPYWAEILGHLPPLAVVRSAVQTAALTVPEVTAASVYFTGFAGRRLSGQVQVSGPGGTAAANFGA